MAEQDREDLVPSVLNDLIDVDGEPADGDGLVRDGDTWRPGNGNLPSLGPVFTIFDGYANASPTYADLGAQRAAWEAMDVQPDSGYDEYPAAQEVLGSWEGVFLGRQRWRPDTPGLYTAYILSSVYINADPSSGAVALVSPPLVPTLDRTWGIDTEYIKFAGLSSPARRVDHITMPISQGMIDADYAGLVVKAPGVIGQTGPELCNQLELVAIIERQSPGSPIDYFGGL